METVIVVAVLGAGAFYVVKKRRAKRRGQAMKAKATAVGWTARQTGWLAGQVRLSIDKAKAEARTQYERGRRIGSAHTGSHSPPSF